LPLWAAVVSELPIRGSFIATNRRLVVSPPSELDIIPKRRIPAALAAARSEWRDNRLRFFSSAKKSLPKPRSTRWEPMNQGKNRMKFDREPSIERATGARAMKTHGGTGCIAARIVAGWRNLWRAVSAGILACLLVLPVSSHARTLQVGPTRVLKLPSEAAAIARDGDRIEIDSGSYIDCAVWRADRLTIVGVGGRAVIADKSCQGKGLFVTVGSDITIRDLTFERARVPDGNGAGIRAEGLNLTVVHSSFLDNEDGILTVARAPSDVLKVVDSVFIGNGSCVKACAHGIYAGHIALLRVTGSRFFATKVGHHIKSRALRTEIVDDDIRDGPDGTSSYLVDIPNGGSLLMQNNVLEKGPHSANPKVAIAIGEEGQLQPTRELAIGHNSFTNDLPGPTIFVRNLTQTPAQLVGNRLKGDVVPLLGAGNVR
jgi:hypothetical protein